MKFLIDMNLSPRWCAVLQAEGWESLHWSDVGEATAPDREIMNYASHDRRVVLTHDLGFGAMLAATPCQKTFPDFAGAASTLGARGKISVSIRTCS